YGLGNTARYDSSLPARFYNYDRNTLPSIKINARGDLFGAWKALAGYRFTFNRITPLYGADDQGTTTSQLVEDFKAGRVFGFETATGMFSRREGIALGGLVYDTRDNEPAARSGVFHEASVRIGSRALGGQDEWQG